MRALQRARACASPRTGSAAVDTPDELHCAICLGCVAAPDAARLDGCTHTYCLDCICAWARVTSRCPLCKQVFAVVTCAGVAHAVEPREQRPDCGGDAFLLFDEEGEEEEQEETPCGVCGSAEDEALLLLCDGAGCDAACHVACAGLDAVPPGDWFCWRCETARRRAAQRARATVPAVAPPPRARARKAPRDAPAAADAADARAAADDVADASEPAEDADADASECGSAPACAAPAAPPQLAEATPPLPPPSLFEHFRLKPRMLT